MIRSRRTAVSSRFLVASLCGVFLLASAASAQEGNAADARVRFKLGSHAFRYCLFALGFEPLDNFFPLQHDQRRSVLIVLGDLQPLDDLPAEWLKDFLDKGGAVLLASHAAPSPKVRDILLDLTGTRITGQRILNLKENLGNPERPLLKARGNTSWLLRGTTGDKERFLRVATYRPSRLARDTSREAPGVAPLAFLPEGCLNENDRQPIFPNHKDKTADTTPPLFAVSREVGDGRLLLLADDGVFLNALMLAKGTDKVQPPENITFAFNALTWLRGADPKRDRALLLINRTVETQFEVPLAKKPTLRQLEAGFFAAMDDGLDKLQRRGELGAFNQGLVDKFNLSAISRGVAGFLTLALFCYAAYRFGFAGQYKPEPGVSLLTRAVGQQRPDLPVLEQRHRAVLREGNLWDEARALARQFFSSGMPNRTMPEQMPRVVASGGWWRRWTMRRRIARLWRLAQGEVPEPVSPGRWRRLLRELEELKADLTSERLILLA